MFSDQHVHTSFSGDSKTPAKEQIEQAIRLGMKAVCITDHHDYDTAFADTNFTLDIPAYIPFLKELQMEYQDRIEVNIGIELGLQLHINPYLEQLLRQYSFDFVIGSSHFIDRTDPYYPEYFQERTERDSYERYFEVSLHRLKEMDCYDVFGHLDYIVRYGPTKNRNFSLHAYQDYIDPILKTLIEKGKGLECNTGGYKYKLGHPNPCEDILTRYRQLGGEILTIGSDAHAPDYLGFDFDRIQPLLEHCGFRYYTVFRQRKPTFLPI